MFSFDPFPSQELSVSHIHFVLHVICFLTIKVLVCVDKFWWLMFNNSLKSKHLHINFYNKCRH